MLVRPHRCAGLVFLITTAILFLASSISFAAMQQAAADKMVEVQIKPTIEKLLSEEDTDNDKKITIDDEFIAAGRGDKLFTLTDTSGNKYQIEGTYYLSNLLQELTLLDAANSKTADINGAFVFEQPADRISRMIKQIYWAGLTRAIDEDNLSRIFADTKTQTIDGFNYIYVPNGDQTAYDYFTKIAEERSDLKMKVVRLPETITAEWVSEIDGRHGILSLAFKKDRSGNLTAVPFVVPGGRFNEMYGWDSYFETLGLLIDGRVDLARSMVDNFVYEINNYGKVLNANRSYYLTRSQPPFLTSMIRDVYRYMPQGLDSSRKWLMDSLAAVIAEYDNVWTAAPRLTETGLSRYCAEGKGVPPEVEPGHFDHIFKAYAARHSMSAKDFEKAYRNGNVKDAELDEFFFNDRCMRESGHDKTYRWHDRCGDFATVDLNCLLYKTETDIADMIELYFNSAAALGGQVQTSEKWRALAEKRKKLINEYCWSQDKGMFLDYDVRNGSQEYYVTPTAFYPLWAKLATTEQAKLVIENVLPQLECLGGLAASSEESRGEISDDRPQRQWDYPYGWPPHQIMAWKGMQNYGYGKDAQRLIYRWLYTITSNAAHYNGTVPEKFNVVTRSHKVFAEYGNVGTDFDYITKEGFGWMNASFKVGISSLTPDQITNLNRLIPPEWIW